MKIVFMGTPEFSVPSLKILIEHFTVDAVLTQPDRPKGRGNKLAFSPVKEVAVQYNIPVYQPLKLKNDPELIQRLKNLAPDFIVVVAFGQILPKEVLDIPKYGCINLHASLLPKYRGAAPIQWAVINGEIKSGNTTMQMDIGLDTGDMLLKSEIEIGKDMTAGELHDALMEDGAKLLLSTIEKIVAGEIYPEKQKEEESSYVSTLNKEMGRINWHDSNLKIHNLVRGLNPWPVAYTNYDGMLMKVFKTTPLEKKTTALPGTVLHVSKDGIEVATGNGVLQIQSVQFPGGKMLPVSEYIKGHEIKIGVQLG